MITYMLEGLWIVLTPASLAVIIGGVIAGIIVGALPGLSASTGIILFLPLTFRLSTVDALLFMCAIYKGAMFGGSISAILVRIPGTPSAAATMLDGYPMAQRGEAGLALTTATISSFIGGTLSVVALVLIAPQLARVALRFGPAEFFSMILFGLTIIASVTGKEMTKGLLAASAGLVLGTVGMDPIFGFSRFTFGFFPLMEGFPLLPVLIGLFAVSEVLIEAEQFDLVGVMKSKISRILPSREQLKRILGTSVFGGLIGIFIGIVPGVGGAIASFVAYGEAKRSSKNPEKFGTGTIEGIAAPESANNATTGGALVPMLTLGIPGDVVTAVMLGILIFIGLTPGPMLFRDHADHVYTVFTGLFFVNFAILGTGLAGAKVFARVLLLPKNILVPVVLVLCILGAFSVGLSTFHIKIALMFGVLGYLMRKYSFPLAPMVLGFILGPLAESELSRALLISRGDWSVFITRPISLSFLIATVLSLLFAFRTSRREQQEGKRGVAKTG